MVEEIISQEFRLKNIDVARSYFIGGIDKNELMSKNHKKACTTLNYIRHLFNLAATVTGCVSISAFISLVGVPVGIVSFAEEVKKCAITAGIKKYKPRI